MDEQQIVQKHRGFLLNVWLILLLIGNLIAVFSYFPPSEGISETFPGLSVGMIYFLGFLAILSLVGTIFLFLWKKWAFYLFVVVSVIAIIMNFVIGVGSYALVGVVGPLVLYLLMKPKWNLFN